MSTIKFPSNISKSICSLDNVDIALLASTSACALAFDPSKRSKYACASSILAFALAILASNSASPLYASNLRTYSSAICTLLLTSSISISRSASARVLLNDSISF